MINTKLLTEILSVFSTNLSLKKCTDNFLSVHFFIKFNEVKPYLVGVS
ncbi:MAG: hypothetical protein FWH31_05870 [Streptococcaceae bacterium]|nr:hypothetical protein [Streptococcaceae bacterium]